MTFRYRRIHEDRGGLVALRRVYVLKAAEPFLLSKLIEYSYPDGGPLPQLGLLERKIGLYRTEMLRALWGRERQGMIAGASALAHASVQG